MANEVVIDERGPVQRYENGLPITELGERITVQYLDVAALSAAFNALTTHIKITNKSAAGLYYKIGSGSPSAAANTTGNSYLGAGLSVIEPVTAGHKIDTAAS